MIRGLAAALQDLDLTPLVDRDLGQQGFQHTLINEPGTTAGDQDAVPFEEFHGEGLQAAIAAESVIDGMTSAGELGRVEHHDAEPLPGLFHRNELAKHLPAPKLDLRQSVQEGILARQRQGGLGNVHADDLAGPGAGGHDPETAGVAEGVQHAPAQREPRDGMAIVALIEIEPGLLAFCQVHQHSQSSFLDHHGTRRRGAPKQSVFHLEAFAGADAALGAQVNALGRDQLRQ